MGKVRGTQFHQFGETIYRNLLREVLGDVILYFPELANGQAAAIGWRLGGDIRVLFHKMRGEELSERGDAGRLPRHARGQKLGAGQADGPQDFVAAKKSTTSMRSPLPG